MNIIKYVKNNEVVIRGEENYKISNFITKEACNNVSLAVSELSGEAPKSLNTASDRIYYFLEGDAEFVFEDQTVKIEPNSSLFIPNNTAYQMIGNFKAVLVNSPAFDIKNETHFKKG